MKLTESMAKTFPMPPGKTEHVEWDDEIAGFGLRMRRSNPDAPDRVTRRLVFQYGDRKLTFGAVEALNFAATRKAAAQAYARVRLGQDPQADKVAARRAARETFGTIVATWLAEREKDLAPKSYCNYRRYMLVCAKALHPMPLAGIRRRDVGSVLVAAETRGRRTADCVHAALSAFFSWCLRRGLIDTNPAIGAWQHTFTARERVLLPAELRAVWRNLEDGAFGAIVKLLALTGQRAGEIGGLRKSELHNGAIVLPAERTKNRRPHVVPLSAPARVILDKAVERAAGDFLFSHRGKTAFAAFGRFKRALDKRVVESSAAVEPWRLHDLRRTFATYAGGGLPAHLLATLSGRDLELARGLGIAPSTIEMVLNHVSGFKAGVAGVYNVSSYEADKRAALDAWAARLLEIVS